MSRSARNRRAFGVSLLAHGGLLFLLVTVRVSFPEPVGVVDPGRGFTSGAAGPIDRTGAEAEAAVTAAQASTFKLLQHPSKLLDPPQEIEAASKKTVELLSNSPYKEKLTNAGLFLKALAAHATKLPNLIQPNLGNQLAGGNSLLRPSDLAAQAPALEEDKIEQLAALPLGSRVKVDPWTNQIALIKAKPVALLSA